MAFQDVAHGLVTDGVSEVGQSADDSVIAPGAIFRAMRTTNASTSGSILGRPGALRCWEPSNFWATSLRCQARIVSGVTMVATSSRACLPNLLPMSARA